ncbi:hypothetical protein KZX45_13190 [Georgenia sp. EYE_87]|uniref:hypothetical protein n=1 Tax=Georgenia sp. EYE_87 TaxID=2853448 RepID=UPI002005A1E8|nr:hypothetical protein [Georgenia sp. EYE_87]MCK6211498.1 hypothetical protein [Georgenia sp. EYE_87]
MNQQEPSTETGGLGERRRRREAERAARLAAERAGQARPLTRRELRIRQLEEQARLEAIATGELPLVDDDGRPLPPEAALARSVAATDRAAGAEGPASRTVPTSQPGTGEPTAASEKPRTAQPPAPSARDRVADAAPTPAEEVRPADASPAVQAAPLSRRSLRDRVRTDVAVPEDGPAERTATARRPVVRAPHTAKGIRTLDSTGTLTGVRPVAAGSAQPARPGPVADEPPVTTDPAGWESAVGLPAVTDDSTLVIDAVPPAAQGTETPASPPSAPTPGRPAPARPADVTGSAPAAAPAPPGPAFAPVRREPTDAERARSAASPGRFPSAASGPEAVAAAALDDGPDDDYDEEEARPQWAPLAEFSAASSQSPDEPTERGAPEPARRSVRDRMAGAGSARSARSADGVADDAAEDGHDDEADTRNPAASLVKIVALVLVAIVIGLLIGLLAFNQEADGASMRIQSLAQATSALVGPNP